MMHIRTSLALFISLVVVSQVAAVWPPWESLSSAAPDESSLSQSNVSGSRGSRSTSRKHPSRPGSTAASGAGSVIPQTSSPSYDSGHSSGGPYDGRTYQGQATTYDSKWSIGNCLLSKWPQPRGLGPVAIAQNLWDSSRMCGACVSITSSFGTYLGIVTDQSDVKPNSLDLGPDVWSDVSNHQRSSALPITWHLVPCNFSAPIQFYNKNGASQYYTAIQVAGSNKPIKSLEARAAGSSDKVSRVTRGDSGGAGEEGWIKLERQSNSNHFGPPNGKGGLGTSADLRVTCDDGKQFVTQGVNLIDSTHPTPASGNCS